MAEKENIITKTYDLILYAIPQINRFPREHKYLLGNRLETNMLDILEKFIEAYYTKTKDKISILQNQNIALEKLRYLVRLCYDIKVISIKKYEVLSSKINELGKINGGWINSLK